MFSLKEPLFFLAQVGETVTGWQGGPKNGYPLEPQGMSFFLAITSYLQRLLIEWKDGRPALRGYEKRAGNAFPARYGEAVINMN